MPPRMLQSGASFYRILSVASDAPVRSTGFSPGRSSPGASAVLHAAADAPIRGVFLSYSLCCLGRSGCCPPPPPGVLVSRPLASCSAFSLFLPVPCGCSAPLGRLSAPPVVPPPPPGFGFADVVALPLVFLCSPSAFSWLRAAGPFAPHPGSCFVGVVALPLVFPCPPAVSLFVPCPWPWHLFGWVSFSPLGLRPFVRSLRCALVPPPPPAIAPRGVRCPAGCWVVPRLGVGCFVRRAVFFGAVLCWCAGALLCGVLFCCVVGFVFCRLPLALAAPFLLLLPGAPLRRPALCGVSSCVVPSCVVACCGVLFGAVWCRGRGLVLSQPSWFCAPAGLRRLVRPPPHSWFVSRAFCRLVLPRCAGLFCALRCCVAACCVVLFGARRAVSCCAVSCCASRVVWCCAAFLRAPAPCCVLCRARWRCAVLSCAAPFAGLLRLGPLCCAVPLCTVVGCFVPSGVCWRCAVGCVLCCAVLCRALLCCAVICCRVLCCAFERGVWLRCAVLSSLWLAVLFSFRCCVLCCASWCCAGLCGVVLCCVLPSSLFLREAPT